MINNPIIMGASGNAVKMYHYEKEGYISLNGENRFSITIPSNYKLISSDSKELMLSVSYKGYTKSNGSFVHSAIPTDGYSDGRLAGYYFVEGSGQMGWTYLSVTIEGNTIQLWASNIGVTIDRLSGIACSLLVADA